MRPTAADSATLPHPDMHLVVQRTSSGSRAVARSIPFGIECRPTDFGALWLLYHLYRYASTNPNIEDWKTGVFRNSGMNVDTWLHSLSYLLDLNTLQLRFTQPVMAPEVFPSDQERLALLGASLHAVASRTNSIPHRFFDRGSRYQAYELGCLLDAAFNADFATVKAILEDNRHPKILLSISGEVIVDGYPDITRRGTALQFALRSGDTEMVELMASYLPQPEFIRQFESVFGTDFAAFERKQKEDADILFEGIEDAFNGASAIETTDARNHVPGTTSALQTKLAAFKSALEKYGLANPTHNDFMLAKAYEIYDKNWNPWSINKLCLFSQQIIGLVQAGGKKTSSFRLQDYAQGIYYRSENETPARSYTLRGTSVDIRSVSDLGSSSCINALGGCAVEGGVASVAMSAWRLEKLCRAKTASFQNLLRGQSSELTNRGT